MYFEQFYLACLSHASYMLGSEGVAVVIDPQRDVEIYLEAAAEQGLKIAHIFETHLHADFVSGHQELAERTGAKIYIGRAAGAEFPHVDVDDGFELQVGRIRLRVLGTPGHTPESLCVVATDPDREMPDRKPAGDAPWAVFTGDTLFIGDVGRPDLAPSHTPQQLAGMLYDSLHDKLLTLPDSVLVYPAHGAGSLCGRNMRADKFSTIGTERLTNAALQIKTRDEFVRMTTEHLPPRPAYFAKDAAINRAGAAALGELPPLEAIPAQRVTALEQEGAVVLDVRSAADFAAAHIPGSLNIGLSGQFASWAGTVLGIETRVVLVAADAERAAEARMRLSRVGIERVLGYVQDGVEGWRAAGLPVACVEQMTAAELNARLQRDRRLQVLDVRREIEWQAGHIAGAHWHALDAFPAGLPALDRHRPVAVHCKSGYRSIIAASLLERAGFERVINVSDGFDGWQKDSLPVNNGTAVLAGR
jgi:hydroxyacylglutathione hydrolase